MRKTPCTVRNWYSKTFGWLVSSSASRFPSRRFQISSSLSYQGDATNGLPGVAKFAQWSSKVGPFPKANPPACMCSAGLLPRSGSVIHRLIWHDPIANLVFLLKNNPTEPGLQGAQRAAPVCRAPSARTQPAGAHGREGKTRFNRPRVNSAQS